MAVITISNVRQLKKILNEKRQAFKRYAQGVGRSGKPRVIDKGYTLKEASRIYKKVTKSYNSLPKLGTGRSRNPETFNIPTKQLKQTQSLVKQLQDRSLPLKLKLKRPVDVSVATAPKTSRQIPQSEVSLKLRKYRNELKTLPNTRAGIVRKHHVESAVRHLTGQSAGRTGSSGGFIYKITEKATGKAYIGQTIQPVGARVYAHLKGTGGRLTIPKFDKLLRKKGIQAFDVQTIATAKTRARLDTLERKYINKFQTTNPRKGFNTVSGNYSEDLGRRIKNLSSNASKAKARGNLKKAKQFKKLISKLRKL